MTDLSQEAWALLERLAEASHDEASLRDAPGMAELDDAGLIVAFAERWIVRPAGRLALALKARAEEAEAVVSKVSAERLEALNCNARQAIRISNLMRENQALRDLRALAKREGETPKGDRHEAD